MGSPHRHRDILHRKHYRPRPGWCQYHRKEYRRALREFERVRAANEEVAGAWQGIGWCQYQLGKKPEAYHAFATGVKLSPSVFTDELRRLVETTPQWRGLHVLVGWSALRARLNSLALAQFQIALTDAYERLNRFGYADGLEHQVAHQAALLNVMVNRAAAALSVSPMVQETHVRSGDYAVDAANPAAAPAAFTRLSSEYRRYLELLVPEGGRSSEVEETGSRR